MKDHEIAQFVTELTKAAKTYGQTQQLRARIAEIVKRNLSQYVESSVDVVRCKISSYKLVITGTDKCIADDFETKYHARDWATENGYKINER